MEGLRSCYMLLMLFLAVAVKYSGAKETELRAHVGTDVALPCMVQNQCGQLHSVKWYKDAHRVYILNDAGDGRSEGDATERMSVHFTPTSVEALLKISPVKIEDEATYKCEITYLEVIDNCDVVQIVKLKTLRKPDVIRIVDGNGKEMPNATVVGPMKERAEVELTCEAIGGKPVPMVTWYKGTTELKRAKYTTSGSDDSLTGKSVLKLSLTRGDILAKFECRVTSEALDEPIISWITTDVHVPPTKVNLYEEKNHVVQGEEIKLICTVPGARPAATIRWKNDTADITNDTLWTSSVEDNPDGTYTTVSYLTLKSTHYHNGNPIHCYAKNKVMIDSGAPELHNNTILDVRYPPVFNFTSQNITLNESSKKTIKMNCFFIANPQDLKGIVWAKDGRDLVITDTNKYEGGTVVRPSISLKNIDRDDMGEYTCTVRNEVGMTTSEGIYLNVQYPPDVEVVMEPSTPIRAQAKNTVLLECNVTSGNPSTLEKVRWFLDGLLMKEFPECNYTSSDENGDGEGYGGPFCGLDPSILSLERVDETFSGNYTCQGKNLAGWGNESEPKELIVYYPPSPARIRYYPSEVVKGRSVTLECIVDSPGRPDNLTYIWHRGRHQMADFTSFNVTISAARLETRSNFTCMAQNEGGESEPASVFINVTAPPAFIQKLPTYQGVLYSSKHINLTCIVECYPECAIIWKKDDIRLNTTNNSLYRVETKKLPPDSRKNDFDSINSTLIWNLDGWPGKMLDISAPNSKYTCESMNNSVGPGVSSTIEIAVDYPPTNVRATPNFVTVIEGQTPSPVKCHGEGHPTLRYQWRKNITSQPIISNELVLGPMKRSDAGAYKCEASNKHGTEYAVAIFNVQYAPECLISVVERGSGQALLCSVRANPTNVTFTWTMRESNDTFVVTSNIETDGLDSYLHLDTSVDVARTYYCWANNTVGNSKACERDVEGNLPWWKQFNQDKMIIIIASIIAIIIIVIIICVIIIILCRRKRADTKSPNNPSSIQDKGRLGAAPPVGGTADPLSDPDKGFYENLPFHGMQNPPNKPYRPDPCDLEYADVDYKSYGPINYKAASVYAAMKRNKNNNKMEEVNKEDLL